MIISPVTSQANSVQEAPQSRVEALRSIKMHTNATTSHMEPQSAAELPISDINEPNLTVEATQPISPQFAALAKQRRALQLKEREILDREKAFLAQSQGSDRIETSRLKSDPLSVLLENGVTYDQLTEAILSSQGNSEIRSLETKLAELERGIEKKFSDRETQSEQAVLAEMKREASQMISQGDEFELVRETRSLPDVMRLIEMTYKESGEVLEVAEALNLVEEELFRRNQKIANLKKMQSLFQRPEPAPLPQQRVGMRTLTNKDTASVPQSAKARALAAFYGTLKK